MPKWIKPDPYADYRDGNCRDASGQIVPCGADGAVSPAKYPKGEGPDDAPTPAKAKDDEE